MTVDVMRWHFQQNNDTQLSVWGSFVNKKGKRNKKEYIRCGVLSYTYPFFHTMVLHELDKFPLLPPTPPHLHGSTRIYCLFFTFFSSFCGKGQHCCMQHRWNDDEHQISWVLTHKLEEGCHSGVKWLLFGSFRGPEDKSHTYQFVTGRRVVQNDEKVGQNRFNVRKMRLFDSTVTHMPNKKYHIKNLTYTSHFIQYEFDPHIFSIGTQHFIYIWISFVSLNDFLCNWTQICRFWTHGMTELKKKWQIRVVISL